jgi:hypothetical protein
MALPPARLAYVDQLRSAEAAVDMTALVQQVKDRLPCTDRAECLAAADHLEWLWLCLIVGRDPRDYATPLTADEVTLLRLELL